MLIPKINILFSRIRVIISDSLLRYQFAHTNRVNVIAKRGSMLEEMIKNKDKRKNWHFNIMPTKAKVRVFEKVHRPHRRRAVLNSLFIKNISDVISTGEIGPEIHNHGIEITGVQISPCFKVLNVFWQVPISKQDSCEEIAQLLNIAAPKIRAELISRNVLGKVPFIYFLRDCTNARIAEFEHAMKELEAEGILDSPIVADDSFTKDLFKFSDSKATKSIEKLPEPVKVETKKQELAIPQKPLDMRSDVFGLDHEALMEKVFALKKKKRFPVQKTAVVSVHSLPEEDDLFSKIPGVCFKADSKETSMSRDAIFKKFHIERKMRMEKCKNEQSEEDSQFYGEYEWEEREDIELNSYDEDFVEDETEYK